MQDAGSTSQTWRVRRARGFEGESTVPPDKSISHRAVLLGALADGRTQVDDFLVAEDTLASVRLARAFGARVLVDEAAGKATVDGVGVDGLAEPEDVVDCANSGTTLRLGSGIACLSPGLVVLTGDESLRRRPMSRVLEPLQAMGADITARDAGTRAPIVVGSAPLSGVAHDLEIASAQVKSLVLLAGLGAEGVTTVHEPGPSRDHTERMLAGFGVEVARDGPAASITGGQRLTGVPVHVPGDLSSAAFLLAAAAIVPGGSVTVHGVGLNPTRTGFLDVLDVFGADVRVVAAESEAMEPAGSVTVGQRELSGVDIGEDLVVRTIDEFPLVAVLATQAKGRTVVADAAELRVKETDRIAVMVQNLQAMGADIEGTQDGFVVEGPTALTGSVVDPAGDHRVVMAMAVAGLVAEGVTAVTGAEAAEVSFPGFVETIGRLAPGAIATE